MNHTMKRLAVAAAVLAAGLGAPAQAQLASGRARPPVRGTARLAAGKPAHSVLGPAHDDRHLVVKFAEGSGVRVRGGRFESDTTDVSRANAVLVLHGGRAERGFTQDEASLDALVRTARARSGHALADLNLYADVFLSDGTRTEALLDALNAEPSVEIAYASLEPSEPSHTSTPSFESQQGYASAATSGIDVAYARTFAGGNGAGVRIVDVERGWNFAHEDLALPSSTLISGSIRPGSVNHGTAVLGELVGRSNGYGVTGLVPGASVRASSACRALSGDTCTTANVAQAITDATWHLLHDGVRAGVILIEQQFMDGDGMFVPVEYQQGEYDAIRTAVASGITVVEAAGNGGQNLDQELVGGRYIFRRSVRDSLAIMVGAGYPPGCDTVYSPCTDLAAVNRPAWWATNYGSRVDVQGWGEKVTTAGYGDLFGKDAYGDAPNRYYTSAFNGTSGASPVVAGAVAALQGISVARWGFPMGPMYVQTALRNTGTPQPSTDASSRPIGPRPDLRRAIPWVDSFGSSAYRITAPTAGTSHHGTMSISIRLNVLYVGSIDRFEAGAYYSDNPGWSAPYWHQPVATMQFRWIGFDSDGNCLGWWDCTVTATWDISRVKPQEVILHGWAVDAQEGFGSNWLPQVRVNVT